MAGGVGNALLRAAFAIRRRPPANRSAHTSSAGARCPGGAGPTVPISHPLRRRRIRRDRVGFERHGSHAMVGMKRRAPLEAPTRRRRCPAALGCAASDFGPSQPRVRAEPHTHWTRCLPLPAVRRGAAGTRPNRPGFAGSHCRHWPLASGAACFESSRSRVAEAPRTRRESSADCDAADRGGAA